MGLNNHKIDFDNLIWEEPGPGVRYKLFKSGEHQVRLLEFSEGFVEPEWCLHGHFIHVLEGHFAIDYFGRLEQYKTGDTVFIPQGEEDKHKAILNKGERVLILLYDMF